jgi:hypothetical protein
VFEGIDLTQPDILLSGGAAGADTVFSEHAENVGHTVVNWSFSGHKSKMINSIYKLTVEHLEQSNAPLIRANRSLLRTFPTKSEKTNNLLRRNFYQVRWSESLYAVSTFNNDNSMLKIDGGTAWACQMYADRFLFDQEPFDLCKMYFFDQNAQQWYQWRKVWNKIDQPPVPSKIYAGIGTRTLNSFGKLAIANLYKTPLL